MCADVAVAVTLLHSPSQQSHTHTHIYSRTHVLLLLYAHFRVINDPFIVHQQCWAGGRARFHLIYSSFMNVCFSFLLYLLLSRSLFLVSHRFFTCLHLSLCRLGLCNLAVIFSFREHTTFYAFENSHAFTKYYISTVCRT